MDNGWNSGNVTYCQTKEAAGSDQRVWFRKSRAAEYLDVSMDFLDKLIEEGKINKLYKLGRKMVFFRREDLDAVFEQHSEIFVMRN